LPKTPALTADCVIFDASGRVLLIRRANEPFLGCYALPGGFVEIGETVEEACIREVQEETGISISEPQLVGIYSDPTRDPRGHTVSVAFAAFTPNPPSAVAGSDAAAIEWVKDWSGVTLAFDHAKIIGDAVRLLRPQRRS
jgi:8-oxo-dGTP diphosphatase